MRTAFARAGLFALAAFALVSFVPQPATAWKAGHHQEMTVEFLNWHPLGAYLGSYIADAGQAAYDVDNDHSDAGCAPTFKRYDSSDTHGVPFASSGSCTLDENHMNYAHSDLYPVENLFEEDYAAALSALNARNWHLAAHKIGHMFHYLEDSAMILHTDCNEGVIDCLSFHGVHESNGKKWYDEDVYYCNKRLEMCGSLGDVSSPVSMHYAFHNFPAFIESDDGKSDVAEMLTLNIHAQGWDAKDNWDLPDDAGDNRASVGDDWYDQFQTKSCQSSVATDCPVNRDIMMTALWDLARAARGTLDQLMLETGLGSSGLGNDQVNLVATTIQDLTPDSTTSGVPDLYVRFYVDRNNDYAYEYRGNTQQDTNDASTISGYTIASNTYNPKDSGSWLPPIPNPRTGTFHLRTDLVDDDPDPNPNDERGTFHHTWTGSGSYGTTNCQQNTSLTRKVCIQATRTGDRWDNTAPVTTAGVSGTGGSGGWWRSGTTVTLYPTDAKVGVAATYYGYSSSGPWYTYTSPVYLPASGTSSLYYYSRDHYGNQEAVKSVTVSMDATNPVTTATASCSLPGNSGWCRSSTQTVTLSCTDTYSGCSTRYYSLDGAAWMAYSSAVTIPTGAHTLYYYSTDVAGNSDYYGTSYYSNDPTAPTASLSVAGTPNAAGWHLSPPTVYVSCGDTYSGCAVSYYRINGGGWTAYGGPFAVTTQGTVTVEAYSVDVAGNAGATASTTFKVDTLAPSSSMSASGTPGSAGWFRSAATASLSCGDLGGSGCASSYVSINGGAFAPYAGPYTVSNTVTTFRYYSIDNVGWQESTKTFTVSSDTVAPSVTSGQSCSFAGLAGWCRGAVTVSGSASDALSGLASLQASVDGGAYATFGGSLSVSTLGTHTVTLRATDVAGWTSTSSQTFKVDSAGPSVSITTPADGHAYAGGVDAGTSPTGTTTVAGDLTVRASASDGTSGMAYVVFSVQRGSVTETCATVSGPGPSYSFSWTDCGSAGATAGTVTLRATAYDQAGNSATASRSVYRTYA